MNQSAVGHDTPVFVAAQIGEKIATAEALGSGGELDECLKIMQEVEKIKIEKQAAEDEYRGSVSVSSQQAQKLRVCEVCSAYLSLYDNDRRLADHFGGKLHLGFVNVRDKIAELKEMVEEKKKSNKPKVLLYRRRRYWEAADTARYRSRSPRRTPESPSRGSSRYERSGSPASRDERRDGRSSPSRRHRHRHRSSSDERSYRRSSRDRHRRSRHSRSRSHDRHKRSRRSRSKSRDRSRKKKRERHSHKRDSRESRRHSRSHSREARSRDRGRSSSREKNIRENSHSD